MPTVFKFGGFRFFFYSNEGNPREPVHIHVERGEMEAKFWLQPSVRLVYNDGFNAKALRELTVIIEERRNDIERAWNDFFRES